MPWRRIVMGTLAFVLAIGLAMRWAGLAHSGWVIAGAAGALIFVFLAPIMGERSRQPSDAPERKVTWHD